MPEPDSPRPPLTAGLTGAEFERWYWLKDELSEFARALGIRSGGSKQALTGRIAARLDGRAFEEPRTGHLVRGDQLLPPLTPDSLIPPGQPCSQSVRRWFEEQVGPAFRFDSSMRDFFRHADGTQMLGDALDYWNSTRGEGPTSIDPQFEYNRFTRAWHIDNPEGSRAELLLAWTRYRALPIDERGRI